MNECLACGNTSISKVSVMDYPVVGDVSEVTECRNVYDCGLTLEVTEGGRVRYAFNESTIEVPCGVLLVFDKEVM